MNSQETVIQLRELKLKGMADAFESILSLPVQNRPAMEATIARLAEAEAQDRRNRKTEMYLKTSRLRYTALRTVTLRRTILQHLQTAPLYVAMRTCSYRASADVENLLLPAP